MQRFDCRKFLELNKSNSARRVSLVLQKAGSFTMTNVPTSQERKGISQPGTFQPGGGHRPPLTSPAHSGSNDPMTHAVTLIPGSPGQRGRSPDTTRLSQSDSQ